MDGPPLPVFLNHPEVELYKNKFIEDIRSRVAMDLAYDGFTHAVISKATGLGRGAVAYRLRRLGVSTMKVRSGHDERAKERIEKLTRRLRKN